MSYLIVVLIKLCLVLLFDITGGLTICNLLEKKNANMQQSVCGVSLVLLTQCRGIVSLF